MMRHNRYDTGHHTGFRAPHLTGNIITTLFSTANVNINLHPLWINFSLLFYTGNRPNLPQKPNEIYTLILQAIQAVTVRNITWQSYSPVYTDNTHTHTHTHTHSHTHTHVHTTVWAVQRCSQLFFEDDPRLLVSYMQGRRRGVLLSLHIRRTGGTDVFWGLYQVL